MEAVEGRAEFLDELEGNIHPLDRVLDRLAAVVPGTLQRGSTEGIGSGGPEGMPITDTETEMLLHRPPLDHLLGVVVMEGQGVSALGPLVGDLLDVGEVRHGSASVGGWGSRRRSVMYCSTRCRESRRGESGNGLAPEDRFPDTTARRTRSPDSTVTMIARRCCPLPLAVLVAGGCAQLEVAIGISGHRTATSVNIHAHNGVTLFIDHPPNQVGGNGSGIKVLNNDLVGCNLRCRCTGWEKSPLSKIVTIYTVAVTGSNPDTVPAGRIART